MFLAPTTMGWIPANSNSKIEFLFTPSKSGFAYTQRFGLIALSGMDAGNRILPDIVLRGASIISTNPNTSASSSSRFSYHSHENIKNNITRHKLNNNNINNNNINNNNNNNNKIIRTPYEPTSSAYPRTHSPRQRTQSHSSAQINESDSDRENHRYDQYIQEITKSIPSTSSHSTNNKKVNNNNNETKPSPKNESVEQSHSSHSHSPSRPSQGLYSKESKLKFSFTPLNTTLKEKISLYIFNV